MRVLIIVSLFVGVAVGQSVAEGTRTTAEDFAFLKGCWEMNRPERRSKITEQWMEPSGGTLLGISRTVRDGKTAGFEYMRIEVRTDGLYFVSKPSENKQETAFPLKQFTPGNAVFENPDHDFPQRVIYRSDKPDTLNARIEGTQNGKSSGVDFSYKRVKCD
jgi:hypothetical protein